MMMKWTNPFHRMTLPRRMGLIATLFMGLLVAVFQNCAKHQDDSPKDVSPFQSNKIKIHSPTTGDVKTKSTDLIDVAVMVDENERALGHCGSFSNTYLESPILSAGELSQMTSPIRIHQLHLTQNFINTQLANLVQEDSCIVGVTNQTVSTMATNSKINLKQQPQLYALDMGPAVTQWESALGLNNSLRGKLAAEAQAVTGNKIKVAVIGTKTPTSQTEFGSLINEPGLDLLDVNSTIHSFFESAIFSLISAKKQNQSYIQGLFSEGVDFLPIHALDDANVVPSDLSSPAILDVTEVSNSLIASGIFRAINSGVQVIYLPVAIRTQGCDPLIGEAIYRATQAGSVVVFPGGDDGLPAPMGRTDILSNEDTISPSCWGPIYSGAISVGGTDSASQAADVTLSQLSAFSSTGNSVEIQAPATSVPLLTQDLQPAVLNGSLAGAPAVVATVAWLQAYHLHKGWKVTPPMIEELILQGSVTSSRINAQASSPLVLHLPTLSNLLDLYSSKTEDARLAFLAGREEAFRGPAADRSARYLRLDSRKTTVSSPERLTITASVVNNPGEPEKDVSTVVIWSLSPNTLGTITNQGVFVPKVGATGRVTVHAVYGSGASALSSEIEIYVTPTPASSTLSNAKLMWISQTDLCPSYLPSNNAFCSNTWRSWTKSISLPQGRNASEVKMTIAFSATTADGVAQDISDQANFYLSDVDSNGNKVGPLKALQPTLFTSSLAPKKYKIVATAKGLQAEADLTITTAIAPPNFNLASATIDLLRFDVTRGWLELYPIALTSGSDHSTEPFSSFDIFLQTTKGQQIPVAKREFQGRYFLKLWGLTSGKYTVAVRLKQNGLSMASDFTYSSTAIFDPKFGPDGNAPSTYQPPFIGKVPTGACVYPDQRIKAPFASGNGTLLAPYVICTPAQFLEMLRLTKGSTRSPKYIFRLRDNLDLSSIPNYDNNAVSSFSLDSCTSAIIEGNGYAIRGLIQDRPDHDYQGLFSCFTGRISNLTLIDPLVIGRDNVGGIAGVFYGRVDNVQVLGGEKNASVVGRHRVGGLFGSVRYGEVFTSGTYRLDVKSSGNFVGGLVGWISDCARLVRDFVREGVISHTGPIGGRFGVSYGGISGSPHADVQSSVFAGTVTSNRNVCGIDGHRITGSMVSGIIRAADMKAAGLACQDYDPTLDQFSPTEVADFVKNVIEAQIEAPKMVAGVIDQASYWDRTILIDNTLRVQLHSMQDAGAIAAVELRDPYAQIAKDFEFDRSIYDSFFWSNNIYEIPPTTATAPEITVVKEIYDVGTVEKKGFDHPEVKPKNVAVNGNQPVASLNFVPDAVSSANRVHITVSGTNVVGFRYKLGPSDSTNCKDATGYSLALSAATAIDRDLAGFPDGPITVCVLGRDSSGAEQSESNPTAYQWRKTAGSPVTTQSANDLGISKTTQSSSASSLAVQKTGSVGSMPPQVQISGYPQGDSSTLSFQLRASGADITYYRVKYGPSSSVRCLDTSGYSNFINISQSYKVDVSKMTDGSIVLCALGKNSAEQWQTTSQATSVQWNKDTKPATINLVGVPPVVTNMSSTFISVSGDRIDAYKYKLNLKSVTDCGSAGGYSTERSSSTAIQVSLTGFKETDLIVCVIARDSAGNWTPLKQAATASFRRDVTPPKPTLTGQPKGLSAVDKLSLQVGPVDGNPTENVVLYRYKYGSSVNCADLSSYSPPAAVKQSTQLDLHQLPNGKVRVCVIAQDRAGNWTPADKALMVEWSKISGN